jgi:hypothetical protein
MKVDGQFHASAEFHTGKELPVPSGREAGWTPGQYGRSGDENNSFPRIDPPIVHPKPVTLMMDSSLTFLHIVSNIFEC